MKLNLVFAIVLGVLISSLFGCKKEIPAIIPAIYGHAGTSLADERAVFPPNSEESIKYALDALNADGVEVDVQLTKDSVLVVFHDENLAKHTDIMGCVNDMMFEDLAKAKYYGHLPLLKLSQVLEWVMARNKKCFLDIKQYNYCREESIDFGAFNSALNKILLNYSADQKSNITVNSRGYYLLDAITDTSIIRCFETEDLDLGINYCENFGLDKLLIRLSAMDESRMSILKEKGIPYCVAGIKTAAEIKSAVNFLPTELITDNIATTKKQYH